MPSNRRDKSTPISIRLSLREKNHLIKRAGNSPLSTYIRSQLFNEFSKSSEDNKKHLAIILAKLGQSDIAKNLRELTDQARSGSLALNKETFSKLDLACKDIETIKSLIMKALRIKED